MAESPDSFKTYCRSARLTVIACCFYDNPVVFKDRLKLIGKRLGVNMRGIIVANGSHGSTIDDPDWKLIQGTNDDLDFSGYAQGVSHWLNHEGTIPAVILFINDSLFKSHNATENMRATLRLLLLLADIQLPAITGKADKYTTIIHRNPWSSLDSYVSTYCFALNAQAVDSLMKLSSWANEDGLGSEVDFSDPNWGHGLSPQFREFLRAKVYYRKSPYAWHGMEQHIDDLPLLRKKARCIYFEHRLSGEIAKCGCILPTNAGPRATFRLILAESVSRLYRRLLD